MRFRLKTAITLFSLCFVAACFNDPASPAKTYSLRLSNVLAVDGPSLIWSMPTFPQQRELRTEQTQSLISIREFLGLRQCKLHVIIAQRNSQIGKVASPSQRLKFDLEILSHGPKCLDKIDNPTLRKKLSNFLAVKRKRIPHTLWYALLAQSEYKALWSQKSHKDIYPEFVSNATITNDLRRLNEFSSRVLSGSFNYSTEEFNDIERTLGRLRLGDAGQLMSELSELHHYLEHANQAIRQRLERKLCPTPRPNEQARYLNNVVLKFFIKRVQAQAVLLKRRYEQLLPSILELESQLMPYSTAAFQEWSNDRNDHISRGLSATFSHSKQLQRLFEQCGLRPGKSD